MKKYTLEIGLEGEQVEFTASSTKEFMAKMEFYYKVNRHKVSKEDQIKIVAIKEV